MREKSGPLRIAERFPVAGSDVCVGNGPGLPARDTLGILGSLAGDPGLLSSAPNGTVTSRGSLSVSVQQARRLRVLGAHVCRKFPGTLISCPPDCPKVSIAQLPMMSRRKFRIGENRL